MDSDNGRRMRIWGIDFIDGRPVLEEGPVTTDPRSVIRTCNGEESDDEVIVLSRSAFEEVLRSRRAESSSAANNRESGETLASNQRTTRNNNMRLEGPSPFMSEPVASPLPPRAPFDCPICMGPFEVTTKCGHVFCEDCISAVSVQSNCLTCRPKVTYQDLMWIYLLWQLSSRSKNDEKWM